ncbi:MarR family winged helix-turn-helix transcriptional regulator [Paenibacillus daejeonensis]|uniref:MarR family winged helix-turn-helix transcriptional regulator n=1 Tax=Paenibacillus daejeonensis TaxID=135193 RepID=UPI0003810743|nr:MarR family transcriptional regulator [Paenibacillus daejeonensis]
MNEQDNLKDSLGFHLGITYRKLVNLFQQRIKAYDITTEQWSVLYQVYQEDGVIQKTIAERLYKDKPTITRLLAQLESKQLIHRTAGIRDKRSVTVRVTPAGAEIIHQTYPLERQLMSDVKTEIGESSYEELLMLLRRVHQLVQDQSDRE